MHSTLKITLTDPRGTAWVDPAALGTHGEAAARQAIDAILSAPATKMLKDDRTRVWAVSVGGRGWVLKRFSGGMWTTWPVVAMAGLSAVRREWDAAHRLAKIGVRVAQPAALVWDGKSHLIVMPLIEGTNLYHVIERREGSPAWRRWLAREIGRQVGVMASHNIINRDHKVGNLIVDAECLARRQPPVLLDPAGLRRRRTDAQVVAVMAHLYGTAVIAGAMSVRESMACVQGLVDVLPRLGTAKEVFRATQRLR